MSIIQKELELNSGPQTNSVLNADDSSFGTAKNNAQEASTNASSQVDQPVKRKKIWLVFLLLHLLLLCYSIAGLLSKTASGFDFLSWPFLLSYGGVLAILLIYALVWQQILKSLPLSIAYANKGITVIWGMLWGYFIFKESITLTMVVGAVLVVIGIILIVTSHD